MLQQPRRRLILNLCDYHIVKYRGHRKEPLRCLTQMIEARVVQENFLDYEGCHCLTQLSASLHYSETKRDYFSLKQETYYLWVVNFY